MSDQDLIFCDKKGARFQPVKHFNRATGRSAYRVKPRGASNRTEDFLEVDTIEEVAKAMLVDGLAARVKAFSGGPVSVLRFGADTLVTYQLNPAIAQRLGIPPRSGAPAPQAGLPQLEQLRARFLTAFADFDTVGAFTGTSGTYHAAYRSRVDGLLAAAATHASDGWAVLQDVLTASQTGRGALPPFFDGDVNWRTPRARDADPAAFDLALDMLTQGAGDPPAAISAFNDVFWPALNAIGEPNTFRDTRVIPSTVLAAVAPDRAISVRYQLYSNAERLLNDRSLFANKPMTANEYRSVLDLAEQIRSALVEWGWKPRDLWDVHGFILATCADRNLDTTSIMAATTPAKDPTMFVPTNLILYGPPGTGKTFATAAEAVELCGESVPDGRDDLMAAYRRLLDAGRIEFVTFHQSMAYEDFVEGLRPTQAEGSAGFSLEPVPGVFRRIARRAETSTGSGTAGFAIGGRKVFKMSLGEASNPDDAYLFEEAVDEGCVTLGFEDIDWSDPKFESRDAIIDACRTVQVSDKDLNANSGVVQMPHIFRNWMREGDLVIVSKGNKAFRAIGVVTGGYRFAPREGGGYGHKRDVEWLWIDRQGVPIEEIYARGFSMRSVYVMTKADLNLPALERYANSQRRSGDGTPEQFVLVIDEINRANISKVFGELITLLEPDKRLGQTNEIKVRLPYSPDPFGVPSNLHIIGTMNTADRSIALLDTALRRRFDFREMLPNPSILPPVSGIDLPALLTKLNERIEYLFDREHQIGHAFFMHCASRADVDAVMLRKVIPLLAEYFHEDWGKIAAVLGDAKGERFLERHVLPAPDGLESEYGGERYRWSVRAAFSDTAYVGLV